MRGPRRSATTTSACARRSRPRTVMRSGSPGPPPTRATDPAGKSTRRGRFEAAGMTANGETVPSSMAVATASRTAVARRGSPPAATAMVTPWRRVTAGTQASEASWSDASTHHTRAASASARTASSTARSPVAVCTSHFPSRSPCWYPRSSQVTAPERMRSASSLHTTGATTVTMASATMSPDARRAATGPPPTTSASRPASRSVSG